MRQRKRGEKPREEGRSLRLDDGRWKSQRSEVRDQISEDRGRRTEVRVQRSETGRQRSPVESHEVGMRCRIKLGRQGKGLRPTRELKVEDPPFFCRTQ